MSSTAARQIATCHKCGGAIYENLVHHCGTAVQTVQSFGGPSERRDLWADQEKLLNALRALWVGVPYQRFGQLIMNLSRIEGGFADTWEWSVETWIEKIEEAMRTWAKV